MQDGVIYRKQHGDLTYVANDAATESTNRLVTEKVRTRQQGHPDNPDMMGTYVSVPIMSIIETSLYW